jgi:hypothetical protein
MQGMRCQTEKPAGFVYIANANDLLPPRAITIFRRCSRPRGDFARHIGNAD